MISHLILLSLLFFPLTLIWYSRLASLCPRLGCSVMETESPVDLVFSGSVSLWLCLLLVLIFVWQWPGCLRKLGDDQRTLSRATSGASLTVPFCLVKG